MASLACTAWLAGCTAPGMLGQQVGAAPDTSAAGANASADEGEAPASAAAGGFSWFGFAKPVPATGAAAALAGADPAGDLALGKRHFRSGNYGLAESYFRKAVELHPRDAEAWLGLAASYDRLRRFDLADRAYKETVAIVGLTPEVLNNQGYSYMLRGDYRSAQAKLSQARTADPGNPYVRANLDLLAASSRTRKAIR